MARAHLLLWLLASAALACEPPPGAIAPPGAVRSTSAASAPATSEGAPAPVMSAVAAPSNAPSAQAQGPSAANTPPPCPPEASAPPGALAWVSGCAILLAKGVIFEFDKATLKRESLPTLDAVAAILHREATLRVEIRGHINAQSEPVYSRRISEQRAHSVMRYLFDQGVARERLSAKGYEGSVPLVDPKTEEGRIKNRRIEFIIVGQ